jgi:SpoVK/Ycf46/Vps4 family AAA+-type ATPase
LTVDLELCVTLAADFSAALELAFREARLQRALVLLRRFESVCAEGRAHLLYQVMSAASDFAGVTLLASTAEWNPPANAPADVIPIDIPTPDFAGRRALWEDSLKEAGLGADDATLVALADRFQFTPGQIRAASMTAHNRRRLDGQDMPEREALFAAAREESRSNLGALATRIEARYQWDDIVLPADQKAQLLEVCNQAENRYLVYGDWGFGKKLSGGKGLNVLFHGPPGTGKTMAAEVIARRLLLDLYKIDLSQVVSKYIGDTEKNLNRVFCEAAASNAILFFDEADALFGKRSEVRDAHDRYANVEIAFLLQKMDEYEGLSILATNLRQNIDDAFLRRLTFAIEFPFPDEASRRQIWAGAWPQATPFHEPADCAFLARQFKYAGGSIKNVALASAFLGAGRGGVEMMDVLLAARRELQKMGRTPSRLEFGAYWDAVQARAAGLAPEGIGQ